MRASDAGIVARIIQSKRILLYPPSSIINTKLPVCLFPLRFDWLYLLEDLESRLDKRYGSCFIANIKVQYSAGNKIARFSFLLQESSQIQF